MVFRPASYRAGFGKVLTLGVAAVGLLALAFPAANGAWADVARNFWPVLFAVAVVWALFWAPELRLEHDSVVVRNVLRTHEVPWPAIERIDTKYAVTLYTPEAQISVWALPAPSRFAVGSMTRDDARHVRESAVGPGNLIRPGDALSTVSGAAAHALRTRWEELRDAGQLGDARTAPVTTRWHAATIAGLLALAGAAILVPLL
ncbi:MAG: PH domain-containing protein [Actinomycetota bacterium]|nr:PH domain-containing protein [Actinomycetota bacterium]